MKCTACRLPTDAKVCQICVGKAIENLILLPGFFKSIAALLQPGSGRHDESGVSAKKVDAPPPMSMHIASFVGPDQQYEPNFKPMDQRDQIGLPSILTFLGSWERSWYQRLNSVARQPVLPCRKPEGGSRWLIDHLPAAAQELADFPLFAKQLKRLSESCLVTLTESQRSAICIGRCPAEVDNDDGSVGSCGTFLYVMPSSDLVQCKGCEHKWVRRDWPILGLAMSERSTPDGSGS